MKSLYSIALALVFTLSAAFAVAQETDEIGDVMRRHEISVTFARPGFGDLPFNSTLRWDNHDFATSSMSFGAGYTHWFSNHIGLTGSASLTYLNNKESLSNIASTAHGTITINNGSGSRVVNTTMAINTPLVSEYQSILMLDLPVQLTLQHRHLFCNLGLAFGVSLNTYGAYTYDPSVYQIVSIDDLGIDINTLPLDAVVVEGNSGDYAPASVKHPLFVEFAADLGWKFHFDNRNAVSLALSLRYALNKRTIDNSYFEIIDVRQDETTARSPMQAGLVDSYRYYVAGLKVTYHWGCGPAAER